MEQAYLKKTSSIVITSTQIEKSKTLASSQEVIGFAQCVSSLSSQDICF